MYLRYTTVRKNGKTRTYWRLVRSVRTGQGVKQVTVCQLGELDEKGRLAARQLADRLVGVERQPGLFDDPAPSEPIALDLSQLQLERGRRFGDVWLALKLWQALRLDELLTRLIPPGDEHVPWPVMAAILVAARLCAPGSELSLAESWFRKTALGDLLGVPDEKINDDRLYRALDQLLPHKEALEQQLKERFGTLFGLEYDLLLYDVASTYFEGLTADEELAKRGYSRDHRSDCLQVCIGLVVTREGFPLGYEVFAGNRSDSTTLREVIERMESKYGRQNRIWAVDRGMVSEEHLEWLRHRGSQYIVGTPKSQLKKFEQSLIDGAWEEIREGLQVQKVRAEDSAAEAEEAAAAKANEEPSETFILCRSRDRAAKERAMRERFAQRIQEGLEKLQERCRRSKPGKLTTGTIERSVGRLMGRNTRAAAFFDVRVTTGDSGQPQLNWKRCEVPLALAELRDGCYLLRTNVDDWAPEELWRAYIHLTDVEAAFRAQKDELGLRPIWHRLAHRIQAHILVCFLGYALQKMLEAWCDRAGLGRSPRKVLDELAHIHSTDVTIPAADGRTIRLRCIVRPEPAQKTLLAQLGLDLPKRLRLPAGIAKPARITAPAPAEM
jgi:transposase